MRNDAEPSIREDFDSVSQCLRYDGRHLPGIIEASPPAVIQKFLLFGWEIDVFLDSE
jgi:hypothetical protein